MTLLISPAYGPMVIIYSVSSTDGVRGGGVNIWDKRNRKPKTQGEKMKVKVGSKAARKKAITVSGSTQCQAVPFNFTR